MMITITHRFLILASFLALIVASPVMRSPAETQSRSPVQSNVHQYMMSSKETTPAEHKYLVTPKHQAAPEMQGKRAQHFGVPRTKPKRYNSHYGHGVRRFGAQKKRPRAQHLAPRQIPASPAPTLPAPPTLPPVPALPALPALPVAAPVAPIQPNIDSGVLSQFAELSTGVIQDSIKFLEALAQARQSLSFEQISQGSSFEAQQPVMTKSDPSSGAPSNSNNGTVSSGSSLKGDSDNPNNSAVFFADGDTMVFDTGDSDSDADSSSSPSSPPSSSSSSIISSSAGSGASSASLPAAASGSASTSTSMSAAALGTGSSVGPTTSPNANPATAASPSASVSADSFAAKQAPAPAKATPVQVMAIGL